MSIETVGTETSYWQRKVGEFKQKASQFMGAYNALLSMESVAKTNPVLYNEWKGLVDFGQSVKQKMEYVTTKIEAAIEWLKTSFDSDDVNYVADDAMSLLPMLALVPIAAIAAAIAIMTKFISDVYIFNKKLDEIHRLETKGISSAQASAIVNKASSKSFFGDLAPVLKWGTIGFISFMLYQNRQKIKRLF